MDSTLNRNSNLKHGAYVLDLFVAWPWRHTITAGLCVIASSIVWSMAGTPKHLASQTRSAVDPAGRQDVLAIAQHIAGTHLFGQNPSETAAANVPASNTAIKVEGLVYADDQGSALAILDVDGKSGFFRVGDVLPDGERLAAIAPTAVQLTQGLAQRVIELPQDFNSGADGILLAGDTGLSPRAPLFPGMPDSAGAKSYAPALRPVSLSPNDSPLDQLRSLREQLIRQ